MNITNSLVVIVAITSVVTHTLTAHDDAKDNVIEPIGGDAATWDEAMYYMNGQLYTCANDSMIGALGDALASKFKKGTYPADYLDILTGLGTAAST